MIPIFGLLTALTPSSAPPKVTFARDVAPILYKNCTPCHREGEVAPFSLKTYTDAKKRSRQIAEITQKRVMPPWSAVHGYGSFRDERRLTDPEIAVLKRWADTGASEGDCRGAPPLPSFPSGWRLGKPDMIIKMPKSYAIPADGKDVYRNLVVPINLPADKWVRGMEFHPGNAKIVHHVILMTDDKGEARKLDLKDGNAEDGYPGYGGMGFTPSSSLGGYTPGDIPKFYTEGTASKLSKKTDLVFSMHYHPSGKPESDKSEIGIYFTDKAPTRRGSVVLMGVLNIDIPAGEKQHVETADYVLPCDLEVSGIMPHMHIIGRENRIHAETPDGKVIPLIWVKNWDINWQGTYRLKTPLKLVKGTKLKGVWTHDNSAENPHNPSIPPIRVKNGVNSTDEMAGVILEVVLDKWEDELALWGANLGMLAKAYFAPPAHNVPLPPVKP